jgi:hypothetical protein
MNRRQLLSSAAAAPLAAAAVSVSAAPPPAPTVGDLIDLAERGSDPLYYGRLLADVLDEIGSVAKDNGDGTISIYSPEWPREAWRKRTVLSSATPIPAGLLPQLKPAPTPFRPLI